MSDLDMSTSAILKKALMFQLKNPDGSVNWMMSVFVWIFLMLILFIIVYFPVKAMKSKFGNTNADDPLQITIRSGAIDGRYGKVIPQTVLSTALPFINMLNEISRKSAPGPNLSVTESQVVVDNSLADTIQIAYAGGLQSLFGSLPVGTVLISLYNVDTVMGKVGKIERLPVILYTDPSIVWLELRCNPAITDAMIAKIKDDIARFSNQKVTLAVTSVTKDATVPVDRFDYYVVGGGRLEPENPGQPWFNQFPVTAPVKVLSVPVSPATTIFDEIEKLRAKLPAPTMQTVYQIEAPASKTDVANAIAQVLPTLKHFAPYETTTVNIVPSPTSSMNISLVSVTSNKGLTLKRVSLPLTLITVPAEISVTSDQIIQAVTSSMKMYNQLRDANDPPRNKTGGPVVIRVEGDMDPTIVRSRLEFLNFVGDLDQAVTMIVKYTQTKNKKRPLGTVFAYIESYDQKLVSTFPQEIQAMVARVPTGSFLGMTKAHYFVNGFDYARGSPNPLLASDRDIANAADPLAMFLTTGKGALPQEENILPSLGCPTLDPCPSCPPERVCPTPDPCPSCPTFDIATMCPKPEACPTFDVATMCPSKPVWPLKAAIPATAKTFNIYYTSTKTPVTFAATLSEAVQMRITLAEKPNANLKIVAKSGYSSGQFGIEVIDPKTKKAGVSKVTVALNNVRKGVEDIYTILAPYL